ncbi:hypothetical protein [Thalassotalea sp. G2M2-11]|uniref:hypothetical protein n=1 Tax=Thalassotalea sp. G2M2-11 TaxID=2787627 RepID=UPI0019D06575|nr:hypothetical protein [Thalassotalea sp. G2M2-11]
MDSELPVKRTKKRKLQKIAKVISYLSTVSAIGCGIFLYTIADGDDKVLKASMGATAFFFFTVGLVLHTIGSADLPDLKIHDK